MADESSKKISFLYLSQDDVLKVGLTMAEAMELCQESFSQHSSGKVENPPKPGVHPLPDAFIHAMPGNHAWIMLIHRQHLWPPGLSLSPRLSLKVTM